LPTALAAPMTHDPLLTKLFAEALACQKGGNLAGTLLAYKRIHKQFPDFQDAWVNAAMLLIRLGRYEEALVAAEKAFDLDGGSHTSYLLLAEAHYWLGHVGNTAKQFEVAYGHYLKVLEYNPKNAIAMLRMSEICCAAGFYDTALGMSNAAVRLEPKNAYAHFCRGKAGLYLADYAGAESDFRRTIELEDDYADAHQSLTFVLLITGRYKEGWSHMRASGKGFFGAHWHDFGKPRWNGEPLEGKTLLVYGHREVSGYGDNIQFARFLPRIKERFGNPQIVLYANETQRRLFKDLPGMDIFVLKGDPLPHFDVTVPMWGLAMATDTDLPDLPPPAPMTPREPPPALPELDRPGLKVGLTWSASIGRRLETSAFDVLADIPGVAWYGLQVPPSENPPRLPGFIDMAPHCGDFYDAAQVARQMDLVVSVDTAMAHLAGSLNVPTVVLVLHPLPDWRWGMGESADWYPSAKVLRQPLREAPESVVRLLKAEIEHRVQ